MLLVSDVHEAFGALGRVADPTQPLLVLGDLLNFIDYRTGDGMVADVLGSTFALEVASARGKGAGVRELWGRALDVYEGDFRAEVFARARAQYAEAFAALEGADTYLTYGNVDIVPLMRDASGDRPILDGDAVEIEGWTVGFVGGTERSNLFGLGDAGPLADRLDRLGPVDILCTHVAPAIPELSFDVITGRPERSSEPVLDYLRRHQPIAHYFGDVHQPKAHRWRIGRTVSRNVGYFRATGRPVHHPARGSR